MPHLIRWSLTIAATAALPLTATALQATATQPAPATPAPTQPDAPAAEAPALPSASSFSLNLDPAAFSAPYTGRLYLILAKGDVREPRAMMGDWFGKTQILAMDVSKIAPGATVAFIPSVGWPKTPDDIPAGEYTVQAVARVSPDSPSPGRGAGDVLSEPLRVRFDPADKSQAPAALKLTRVVTPPELRETDRVKLFSMTSPSLSKFLGRDRAIRAAVVLPKDWKENDDKKYPTIYWIGGFGDDHRGAARMSRMFGDDVMIVVPDPQCYRGHTVFADSANNGPWGKALTEELIPAVEAKFHGAGTAEHRHVTGMSSGGWSSLWLMVSYPETFAACWSFCPDPVDFHDFQRIDLYAAGSNMYRDQAGERRPLARGMGDSVSLYYQDFVAQETVMGPGGQIHAFEAVFSPKAANGEPRPLFDRATGAVDTETAKLWEPYDIRRKLEREWPTLGPKLKGKIHVYAGEKDTFYLEGAAVRLKASLEKLGSDAVVEIIPGLPHAIHRPGIQAMMSAIRDHAAEPVAP